MKASNALLLAAVSGILFGVEACGENKAASNPSITNAPSTSSTNVAPTAKHACKGQNDCKGQGGCKG